jgi:hypothetical protein
MNEARRASTYHSTMQQVSNKAETWINTAIHYHNSLSQSKQSLSGNKSKSRETRLARHWAKGQTEIIIKKVTQRAHED